MLKIGAIFILVLLAFGTINADEVEINSNDSIADSAIVDSGAKASERSLEYFNPEYVHIDYDSAFHGQSPTTALFKSMLIPGWGQLSNKKYIKAGAVIGFESILIGSLFHYIDKTKDARKRFDNPPDTTPATASALFDEYEDAKNDRNRFAWYLGTFVFFSMFDAFVDAHLADFPKKGNKISIQAIPEDIDRYSVRLTWAF